MMTTESNEVRSYRDLLAWQRAIDLVCQTCATTDHLPPEERYGLTAQMRRSAVSVPSNIAEGWGRHFGPEYIRFLEIARASVFELSIQAEICRRLGYNGIGQV